MGILRLFRCEVDPACAYHCDALAERFPEADGDRLFATVGSLGGFERPRGHA
ncbi:MAG: hypothetical protein V5A62_09400 [Haloarculaceae archaeon]